MELLKRAIISVPFYSKPQFQEEIQELRKLGYPIKLIEIRWDFFSEEITKEVATWINNKVHSAHMKTIFTFKNKNLSQEDFFRVISLLISYRPDYIDLDVDIIASKLTEFAELAYKNHVLIVYSYHNYKETPSLQILKDMFEFFLQMLPKITFREGHILKMVFTANSSTDVENVMKFCSEFHMHGIPLITFCMGEIGRTSRIQCIKEGAAYSYFYFREPTAIGQISIRDLR